MNNSAAHDSRLYAVDPAALDVLLQLGGERDDSPLEAPVDVPGYLLVRQVSRGGQAVVYEAVAPGGSRVAVKILREGPFAGAAERARLEREAQVLSRLRHPNLVPVVERGTAPGGWQYLVTEWVEGLPLDAYVERLADDTPPDELQRRALGLFVKVCEAVDAAHRDGVVHRDLKPSNVLVDRSGEPVVLDFGLASDAGGGGATAVTGSGQFVGSLPWASPEQLGRTTAGVGARSDVYSLGVLLYQLLAGGRFPYPVEGPLPEVVHNVISAPPRRLRDVPHCIETIVRRALAKRPAERFATAGELGVAVQQHLEDPTPMRRQVLARPAAVAAAAVLVLAAPTAYYASRPRTNGLAASTQPSNSPPTLVPPRPAAFATSVLRTSGGRARAVCAADFDGDGLADLAAVSASADGSTPTAPNAIDVFIARPDGTFAPRAPYASGRVDFSHFLIAADLNGDRRPDLVTGTHALVGGRFTSSVVVLLNRGDGTFGDPLIQPCDYFPTSAAAGDYTGDGKADLVVINGQLKCADVFAGHGDGTFTPGARYPKVSSPSLSFDADGDGRLDVATSWMGCVALLLGDGAGAFPRRRELTFSNTIRTVALADATGGGRADLIATVSNHLDTATVLVWPGGPRGERGDATPFDRPPVVTRVQYSSDTAAADFNGDGRVDLMSRVNGWAQEFYGVQLWLGAGDGTFTAPAMLATLPTMGEAGSADGVAVADFNGDGWTDAAVAHGASPEVTVLMNRTTTR